MQSFVLVHTLSILPVFPEWLWMLGSYQDRCRQDWCSWPRMSVCESCWELGMVPPCAEWWSEIAQATTTFTYYPSTAFLSVRPHCANTRRNRCYDLNSFPLGELEETTKIPSYYMDEDYSAGL